MMMIKLHTHPCSSEQLTSQFRYVQKNVRQHVMRATIILLTAEVNTKPLENVGVKSRSPSLHVVLC